MGNWSEHGSATGGYYECNVYKKKVDGDSSFADEEKKRSSAKNELDRYLFFFERYQNHERSARFATQLLPKLQIQVDILVNVALYPLGECDFLLKACETVIRSREVLKWTYAYGFYAEKSLAEHEYNLFNTWQQDLEKYCEHLAELIEKPLDQFVDPENTDKSSFYIFRGELQQYYQSTENFRKNLIAGVKEREDRNNGM